MLPVLILLLLGTLAYLFWRRMTTTLTRSCRWRRDGPGQWHCAFCGGRSLQDGEPRHCARQRS